MIFDERNLDHTCALAEATDLAMKTYAADRGWDDYDFEDDTEDLRNLLGSVIEALAEDGWLDLDRYLSPAH